MWRTPDFWQKRNWMSWALTPLAYLYEKIALLRLRRKPEHCPIPVICVGNIVIGGAGKTPLTLFLADQLASSGRAVTILTRGFGSQIKQPVFAKPDSPIKEFIGDEAKMMASTHKVVIGKNRILSARLAVSLGADILIMDDGFQNPSLNKDMSFLVIDSDYGMAGYKGLGNGRLLPAGPLREPLSKATSRADALILMGEGKTSFAFDKPLFHARLEPETKTFPFKQAIAFSAIGRNEKFFQTLASSAIHVRESYPFADHHCFKPQEARFLLKRALDLKLALITTQKDYARLEQATHPDLKALKEASLTLKVQFVIKEEKRFLDFLKKRVEDIEKAKK